ncbi:sacsin N-terminal ATP-binding-like domain-containing protein [Nocardia amikacinitolerans]|uniref:sacsin N-terminal ATP-binding-like domain-containing protein n=1 Tax=Nocardia amikacinitolerans TaxID=756689 RepID=UPI001FE75133|nr:ATP-binding protein [Nocardia amikacinitolerans]
MRAAVLASWRDSPTRLREDAATEADLVRAGYRDRLLTELAQNAADAAAKAGVAGRISVRLDGRTLYIANTGAPLDLSGVHALTALRASGKAEPTSVGRFGVGFTAVLAVSDDIEFRSTTGSLRFSRARTREALREHVADHHRPADVPHNLPADSPHNPPAAGPIDHSANAPYNYSADAPGNAVPNDAALTFQPPVLRLTWPLDARPAPDFDTEVVLRLRDDIDADALLATMRGEAADLLLELPALQSIRIGDAEFASAVRELGDGLQELQVTGPDDRRRTWWQFRTARARWLLPLRDGKPHAAPHDVLRAPTRSDEELSLPALLIADISMQPDRRRLLPGARVAELASGYADFARALPPTDRLVLVPTPGFARSEVDGLLREALIRELQTHSWLPVVGTPSAPSPAAEPSLVAEPSPFAKPRFDAADVLDAPGSAAESSPAAEPRLDAAPGVGVDSGFGAEPRLDAAPGVVAEFGPDAEFALHPTAVPSPMAAPGAEASSVGGSRSEAGLGTEPVHGTPRPSAPPTAVPTRASVFPDLTTELADLLDDIVGPLVIPELSTRAHTEALAVLDVHRLGLARLAELSGGVERPPAWWRDWYAALEPFVVDPLSAEELGALAVPLADGRLVTGPRTVVLDDMLEVAIPLHWARLVHPEAAHPLLSRLGARAATAADLLADPALQADLEDHPDDPDLVDAVLRLAAYADPDALPPWLGSIELPDTTGELLPADELLLPEAPLYALLVEDAPLGTVAKEIVDEYGAQALRAVGVGWDFGVVSESDPTGPDHHLDDEESWWASLPEEPAEFAAVRDLDLIDDIAWPDALHQLLAEPKTRRLLADPDGYTAWWLRRHARLDGIPLGHHLPPGDTEFAGLLPQFAVPGLSHADLDVLRSVLADPDRITPDLAEALLSALADPANNPELQIVSRTHRHLAAAASRLDLTELELPERVRALSGDVVPAADAMVLDLPWFGLAMPPERLVLGDEETAPSLATLLDLPLVSESVTAEVLGTGHRTSWSAEPLGVVLRQLFSLAPQHGELVLHEDLRVRLSGAVTGIVSVPWWRVGTETHIRVPSVVDASD